MQRRILSLVIFLLTLFPLLGIVDGSAVKAQHWTYEDGSHWLPDLDVDSNNEKCETCGHYYDPEEGHECWYECEYCHARVSDLNQHYKYNQPCADAARGVEEDDEPKDGYCCICGLPIDQCTCTGGIEIGNRPSWGGGSSGTGGGFTGSVGGYWYPDNNNVDINPPFNPTHQKIDGEHLFKEHLPAQSMKQETSMTCVPTAMANLLSHMGSQQSPQEIRDNIEIAYDASYSEENQAIKQNGVDLSVMKDFMQVMGFYTTELSDIVDNIDNSIPCLAVIEIESGILHMMEIVGYFESKDYFQTLPEAFQCIDPGTGEYTTVRIEKIQKYSNYIFAK